MDGLSTVILILLALFVIGSLGSAIVRVMPHGIHRFKDK